MIRIKGTGVSKSLIKWDDKIYVEFKVNKWVMDLYDIDRYELLGLLWYLQIKIDINIKLMINQKMKIFYC